MIQHLLRCQGIGVNDYSLTLDEYDQDTGYYLKEVQVAKEGSFLSGKDTATIDIYIHFPMEDKGAYVFGGTNDEEIVSVLYETAFDEKTNSVKFNDTDRYSPVKNNNGIKKREMKHKLLITTYNKDSKIYTFWITSKRGKDTKQIKRISETTDWHLDILNSKIRFVKKSGKSLTIDSLEW